MRRMVEEMTKMPDSSLRIGGVIALCIGVFIVWMVKDSQRVLVSRDIYVVCRLKQHLFTLNDKSDIVCANYCVDLVAIVADGAFHTNGRPLVGELGLGAVYEHQIE